MTKLKQLKSADPGETPWERPVARRASHLLKALSLTEVSGGMTAIEPLKFVGGTIFTVGTLTTFYRETRQKGILNASKIYSLRRGGDL